MLRLIAGSLAISDGRGDGAEIGKALLACRRRLMKSEDGDRMIVLISDGYSSDLSGGNDMTMNNPIVPATG